MLLHISCTRLILFYNKDYNTDNGHDETTGRTDTGRDGSGNEKATPDEGSGTAGGTGSRESEQNTLLFFDGGKRLLHGVITADHRWRGSQLERKLREFAMDFNFKGRSQTGVISLHITDYASHLHWVHECHNYHGDCKCSQTRAIRQRGFSIKWKRIGRINHWWERNLILYLQKQGRHPLQAFRQGEDQMEEFLHAAIKADSNDRGRTANIIRCDLDNIEDGRSSSAASSDDESMVSSASRRSQGSWQADKGKARGKKDLAKELHKLIERKLPASEMELIEDPEYMQLMEPLYYVDDYSRKQLTQQVFDNFKINWNRKSLMDIIVMRAQNETTFNEKNYYTPKYSLYIIMQLLIKQMGQPWEFIDTIIKVLNREVPKKNTISIIGAGGCGKTYFLDTLSELLWNVGELEANINKSNNFPFEGLLHKRLGILNEFNCSPARKDTCKELFEGKKTPVNIKYGKPTKLKPVPIIITTNNNWLLNFDKNDAEAFRQRCFFYNWQPQPWLRDEDGYPHPLLWAKLILLTTETRWATEWLELTSNIPPKEYNTVTQSTDIDEAQLININKNLFN